MKTWVLVFLIILVNKFMLAQDDTDILKGWTLFQSPTRNKISHIIGFENGKAIAAANKLFLLDSTEWTKAPMQPPVPDISRIYALNNEHIWVIYSKLNNESDFFLFKDGKWQEMSYPLMNGIHNIHLNEDGEGWFCGDREIAYFDGETYKFIPFPSKALSIQYSYGNGFDNLWISPYSSGLYHFNGNGWNEFFSNQKVKYFCFRDNDNGYALVENTFYTFSSGKWVIHSKDEVLDRVNKIYVKDNEIWGIGTLGLLVNYNFGWQIVPLPVKSDLYDITFTKDGTGWIAGDKGIILKYTSMKTAESYIHQPGFDRLRITSAAKENSDEYGVVIEDFDGDGLKDIYVICLFELNRLYKNKYEKGNILFTEESLTRNISGRTDDPNSAALSELYLGAGSADIDNDGDQDIYLCDLINKNKLLLNDGNGFFRDVSDQNNRAVDHKDRTNAAIFSDVDNDGDLDLFVLNEYSTNRLYLNNGYGYFTEVTIEAGLATDHGGMGAAFADLNDDNLPDLYVVNWAKPNILYRNVTMNGKVKFERIADSDAAGGEIKKSNAAIFGDFDNDGDMDLFVTNRRFSNRLYRNDGNFIFTDVTDKIIGFDSMTSYGANFADFDNDGYLDLFIANVGENKLFKNIRGKKFVDVTEAYGVELDGYSTGSACGDIDNDGDIDIYVANYLYENSMLFLNNINNQNYINLNIEGNISNRDAVGTKIWLYHGGRAEQAEYLLGYREISGGSGYSSKDSREVHFGVEPGNYDIVIYFPASGIKKNLNNVPNGVILKITELEGFNAKFNAGLNYFYRSINDRENQKELFKLLFILLLFNLSFLYGIKKYKWRIRHAIFSLLPVLAVYLAQIYFLRYENVFFSTVVPLGSVMIILLSVHLFFEKSFSKERVRNEKQKTRDILARDLHDDLASTISSALIYTEMVERSELPDQSKQLLSKIRQLLAESAKVVTDIIWTVSPSHDNIDELVSRLQTLMGDLCSANSIEFSSSFYSSGKDLRISDDTRRNIYLIYKEAINNTIKHSSATNVNFNVYLENDLLNFSLFDNGIGFDKLSDIMDLKKNPGHGLRNIHTRAGEINADLQIKSGPKQGTYINVRQKIVK
jgi:two-component sensor histidine kinase